MADYKAKKEAAVKRIAQLREDQKRIATKLEAARAQVAECDKMMGVPPKEKAPEKAPEQAPEQGKV